MCANEGVTVEPLASHEDLAGSFGFVPNSAGPELRRQQRAIWVSVWVFGGTGVGGPLAVVSQKWQGNGRSLLTLAFKELFGLLGEDRRLRGFWHSAWADIDPCG